MPDTNAPTAGIDAFKSTLNMAIHGRAEISRVPNTAAGWMAIAATLAASGILRVGIEATGGYERGVVDQLRADGIAMTVLQPMQVKAFGMLHLRRVKTDRIDAALIAACTHVLEEQGKLAADSRFEKLGDHLIFIEQVEEDDRQFRHHDREIPAFDDGSAGKTGETCDAGYRFLAPSRLNMPRSTWRCPHEHHARRWAPQGRLGLRWEAGAISWPRSSSSGIL